MILKCIEEKLRGDSHNPLIIRSFINQNTGISRRHAGNISVIFLLTGVSMLKVILCMLIWGVLIIVTIHNFLLSNLNVVQISSSKINCYINVDNLRKMEYLLEIA